MKVKILASGSKGNSTYIECGKYKFLIDAGIIFVQIKTSLDSIGVDIKDIDFVLISHVHSDHIKGLGTLVNKTSAKIILNCNVFYEIKKYVNINNYEIVDNHYQCGELSIELLTLSHDVSSYGFLINYMGKSLVYITDTGYINRKYHSILKNKDIYIIESNYDEKMLMDGPYPYILKQRIVSDKGHLSNHYTGKFLAKCVGQNTKYIFLAHISEHNNTKEIAIMDVKEELKVIDFDLDKVFLSDQYVALELFEV